MDFIRENPPSHGHVVDFEILIRETPHVYGQTEHFESTVLSNKDHSSEQDSLAPQKTKHPCRLTEVSEAEQRHSPRRIAKHLSRAGFCRCPAIINHSVSGNYRHITDKTSTKNLRIVNKRFKNRIKHLKIVKILIG